MTAPPASTGALPLPVTPPVALDRQAGAPAAERADAGNGAPARADRLRAAAEVLAAVALLLLAMVLMGMLLEVTGAGSGGG